MEKIILGIDPGTNLMDYGLLKVVDGKAQMITMGVIDLRKFPDAYMKLGHIFERVTGSWRWAIFAAVYTTAVAWIASALVFQIGRLFI